jgi:hypothetical protein
MEDRLKRVVEIEGYGKFVFLQPSVEDIRDADLAYSIEYTMALKDGSLSTNDELEKILDERNIFTKADNDKIAKLDADYLNCMKVLAGSLPKNKREKYVKDAKDAREASMMLKIKKNVYLSHTIESRADSSRIAALMQRCVFNEDGTTRLWEKLSDYNNERDQLKLQNVSFEFTLFMNNMTKEGFEQISKMESLISEAAESIEETKPEPEPSVEESVQPTDVGSDIDSVVNSDGN